MMNITINVGDETTREAAGLDDQRLRKLGIMFGWKLRDLLKTPNGHSSGLWMTWVERSRRTPDPRTPRKHAM